MPKSTPLTPQQERFCQEYAVDYNGTNAAKRAGYSESTAASQASRLLKNAKVLSRVRAIQKEQLEKTALTKASVLLNLMDVYDRCMQKKPVTEWDYEAGEYKETGTYAFDSKGALRALELLGKHLAMFTNKIEHSGNVETGNGELSSILEQLKSRSADAQ
ncbi:MAG: terminase small subunit [Lachnospiraceae bacterium]